ncbi:MAG TPA: hypothetical protein VNM22_11430 [Candidatus Limnocylindrales bacterium]|nr:hypothetical protein [Candidatus Limnocylindrales bacterium]
MADTTRQEEKPSSQLEGSTDRRSWQKARKWFISVLIIFVFSAFTEKIVDLLSPEFREKLRNLNDSFVRGVEQVDPFKLSRLFYRCIWNGPPSGDVQEIYDRLLPSKLKPPILPGFKPLSRPWAKEGYITRVMDAGIYTGEIVIAGGMVSIAMAIIALTLGVLMLVGADIKSPLVYVLLAPIIGGCFLWVLLLIMRLAGLLFGWLLETAQLASAISTTIPFFKLVVLAVVKEREHHITSKVMERIKGEP